MILNKIDVLIEQLFQKDEIDLVGRKTIILLTFIKLELKINNNISDISFGALSSIAGKSYQKYKDLEDDIHEIIQSIYSLAEELNNSNFIEDLEVPFIDDRNNWVAYFAKAYKQLDPPDGP